MQLSIVCFIFACLSSFVLSQGITPQTEKNTTYPLHDVPAQVQESASVMFKEYWQFVIEDNPELATILGDHRYDSKLSSYSLRSYERREVVMSGYLERANQLLALADVGSDTETNLQLFIADLQFKLDHLKSRSYLFPVSKMWTPAMAFNSILKYAQLKTTSDYGNLIARYKALPTQTDEQIELMREGILSNFTLSERSLFPISNASWDDIENSPYYKPFLNISDSISIEEAKAIQENASDAIRNHLLPSFGKLEDFLNNEYKLHARPGIGVSSLPNGRAFYQSQLSYHLTDAQVTPEQIHQLGLEEVQRISQEMEEVIHSLGLNATHQEFSEQLRNYDSQYFSSPEDALETYRHVIEMDIAPKLPQIFKFIPDKKLEVEPVPKDLATGPIAYYMMPSADNSTPGTFFVDVNNLRNLPKYDVVTLSMHEGVPGHHFQFAYTMDQSDVPDFRKYGIHSTAFIEGWALYAEYLGYELGLFEDPYMRYGHLSYEIFRACRMVVDTGMHVMGWSREEAVEYMKNNSASPLGSIEREIDRYITWPGQACAYKFGELKIKEMRKKAEESMGEAFDIKEFHDIILRNNGPLELVAKQVDRYIATSQKPSVME